MLKLRGKATLLSFPKPFVVISLMMFTALYGGGIKDNIIDYTSEKVGNTSFLSVLKNYYRAKKEKICPFIKFED